MRASLASLPVSRVLACLLCAATIACRPPTVRPRNVPPGAGYGCSNAHQELVRLHSASQLDSTATHAGQGWIVLRLFSRSTSGGWLTLQAAAVPTGRSFAVVWPDTTQAIRVPLRRWPSDSGHPTDVRVGPIPAGAYHTSVISSSDDPSATMESADTVFRVRAGARDTLDLALIPICLPVTRPGEE